MSDSEEESDNSQQLGGPTQLAVPSDYQELTEAFERVPMRFPSVEFLVFQDAFTYGERNETVDLCGKMIYHGYLPMAAVFNRGSSDPADGCLLAKIHYKRCVVDLKGEYSGSTESNNEPNFLNSKSRRKRVEGYRLQVKYSVSPRVCDLIRKHTEPEHNWLIHPLQKLYERIGKLQESGTGKQSLPTRTPVNAVRMVSVEVYCKKSCKLVAGELGYTTGSMYTSLTGFYDPECSGSGTAQLLLLGDWLLKKKCPVWDLGMGMEYKRKTLGAKEVPRKKWLELVKEYRDSGNEVDFQL